MDTFMKITISFSLVFIIISLIYPILTYSVWYRWWKQYDPNKEYKCFNLTKIAYYNHSIFLYRILNMFGTGPSQIKYDWWIYLITNFMKGAAKGMTPGGYATPKSFCESLIPRDYPYQVLDFKSSSTIHEPQGWTGGEWPTDVLGWKGVISAWGDISWVDNKETGQIYTVGDPDKWFSDPDNFLATWGIPPDAPMIVGFLTGWDMYQNSKTYIRILYPLLGIREGGSGGWWGFLQMGDNFGGNGMLEVNRIVWSDDVPSEFNVVGNKSKGCNVSSAVSGGIGGAGVGAMVGAAAGPPGIIIGAIIGGLGGGLGSAAANNCL